ncbi:hypothetical protein [Streptomyces sp. NPDC060035]|uniref:hypothetical protein n=1 Tax=Streptomyces sp. NPDC060035 TaxID=3347044 RepID=UPI0036A5C04A
MTLSRRRLLTGAAAALPAAALLPTEAAWAGTTPTAGPTGAGWAGKTLKARRLGSVVTADMMPADARGNIAGPSPIATPDGLRLYFADHNGDYIRLAFADHPAGPWQVHAQGTFPVETVLAEAERTPGPDKKVGHDRHIASPDVHRLSDGRWRMYFHARPEDPYIPWGHENGVAHSVDGLDWHLENRRAQPGTYLRGFQWRGGWYGVMREGVLMHSEDGITWPEEGVPEFAEAINEGTTRFIRHVAVVRDGNVLSVFYSRIGDSPERIMRATCTLTGSWKNWRLTDPVEVLRAEEDWEGGDLPPLPSEGGEATKPVNELRDPGILDYRGRRYLFYSYRGEHGIAVAELTCR